MHVLIRTQPGGNAPGTERHLEVPRLRLGRGAEQDVVLNDLRIALEHAEILPAQGLLGPVVRIEARSPLPLWINGGSSTGSDLSPGDEIAFGRYTLRVLKAPPGIDLALDLIERHAAHDSRGAHREALRQTPADAGWSRRWLAWGLFLLVLLPGLVLPVLTIRSQPESVEAPNRERPRKAMPGFDILWSSGPLSRAHHALQNDCAACHRRPFEQADDEACRGCHTPLREHAGTPVALGQPPFAGQQCTDCHREHNGADGMVPRDNGACTDCHAQPISAGSVRLEAAPDFSHAHPPFRVRLARREGDTFLWPAVRQDDPAAKRQDSGLKFPHDLHLAKDGIDGPEGRQRMECGDCHQPNADRSGFLPVTMAANCADCHRLDFDPADPGHELPHGKPEQAVRIIRDYYAAQAFTGRGPAPVEASRRRPGEAPPTASSIGRTPAWATARAEQALRDVFERRTCFYCHTVSRDGPPEAPWSIAPVAPQRLAFAGSVFPHSAHATETCSSCHQAETSQQTEDVLLPDIARCRDCHGDTGAMRETPSSCQSCHGYHTHPLKTAGLAATPAP